MQDEELAVALRLLQMMWNKDYQACSYCRPSLAMVVHACPAAAPDTKQNAV